MPEIPDFYNPHEIDISTENVTIGEIEYIVDSWSKNPTDVKNDSTDSKGVVRGSWYVTGKPTLSLTVRKVKGKDPDPQQYEEFTFKDNKWVIVAKPTVSGGAGTETTYALECDDASTFPASN